MMEKNTQPFEFNGNSGEFFKIWIVNLMLTIVTLGIYSAWAKVRNKKYFYKNTVLLGSTFDYLADPVNILKGRMIALTLVLLYYFSSIISLEIQAVIVVLFIPVLPWVIIKSLKFNLYNSAYRNIRFHFDARYLTALWVFIGLPIIIAFTAGFAYPYMVKEIKKFVVDHSAYGTSKFKLSASTGQFYVIYLKTFCVVVAMGIIAAVFFNSIQTEGNIDQILETLLPSILLIYPVMFTLYVYVYTAVTNLTLNHTTLHDYQLESNLETVKVFWLYLSNLIVIIISCGLLIPWAMIRMTKYRVSCLALIADDKIESFIAGESEKPSALGDELGDILDIDLGL